MSARTVFGVFGVVTLIAVAAGCIVAAMNGIAIGVWGRNLGAWIVGGVLAIGLARGFTGAPTRSVFAGAIVMALAGLLASLAYPGLDGVHRWIVLGPVRLNAAELLLPIAVVASAKLGASRQVLMAMAFMGLILAAQPDRSQAVALAGAVAAMLLASTLPVSMRLFGLLVPLIAAGVALARPDPLKPVAEVEGILGLAWIISPFLAALCLMALSGAVVAPLAAARSEVDRPAALALCTYLALSVAASFFAPFPVPLVGMGVGPILGAWLGIGLLLRPKAASAP